MYAVNKHLFHISYTIILSYCTMSPKICLLIYFHLFHFFVAAILTGLNGCLSSSKFNYKSTTKKHSWIWMECILLVIHGCLAWWTSWHWNTLCINCTFSGEPPCKEPVMQSFDVALYISLRIVEQTVKLPVIWDAMMLIWCHCSVQKILLHHLLHDNHVITTTEYIPNIMLIDHILLTICGLDTKKTPNPSELSSITETTHNKSSQWLPNTPFASISECLVS